MIKGTRSKTDAVYFVVGKSRGSPGSHLPVCRLQDFQALTWILKRRIWWVEEAESAGEVTKFKA